MNRVPKIKIRHFSKGRFVRGHIWSGDHFIIGTSRGCNARVYDHRVAGVAALIKRTAQGWVVVDLGSETLIRLDNKSFIETVIEKSNVLQVGQDEFRLEIVLPRRQIYTENAENGHYTVVKWRGRVIKTGDNLEISPEMMALKERGLEVIKSSVKNYQPVESQGFKLDREMKKPLISTFLTIFIFVVMFLGIPMPKKEEEKPKTNQFTKMIYDSKVLAQKKQQLTSFAKQTPTGTGAGNGSISEGAKGRASQATKAVQSIRQAGLQSLIGKIASRASSSAKLIAQMAGTPSAEASAEKFSGATVSTGVTGKGVVPGNAKGFELNGIGTGGKGGGTGGYKAGSGLGTGSVGNGEVGLDDTESVIEGGLDREVIAAIIRDHLGQIRYCYERQLSASPELYGKVKVKFSIDGQGVVGDQSVAETTLKNALVEECILRRIATWAFPKPKGGTRVLVSYPFLFKSVQ